MEACGPPCGLRDIAEAVRSPASPRKGPASVSPTHPGIVRKQPTGGLGVDFRGQQLGLWLTQLQPLEAARHPLVVTEINGPSRDDGAGPRWQRWARRSGGTMEVF